MGSAIAKNLSKGSNRLLLFANDRKKVEAVANHIKSSNPLADVEALDCPANAAWEADIIILAVPHEAEKEIAEKIKEVANQKL
jgi:predicted dinucleotide-binding enzyme